MTRGAASVARNVVPAMGNRPSRSNIPGATVATVTVAVSSPTRSCADVRNENIASARESDGTVLNASKFAGETGFRGSPCRVLSLQTMTSRSGSAYGSGRRRTAFTTLKMALFAPMPSARESDVRSANTGARANCRNARRRSAESESTRIIGLPGLAGLDRATDPLCEAGGDRVSDEKGGEGGAVRPRARRDGGEPGGEHAVEILAELCAESLRIGLQGEAMEPARRAGITSCPPAAGAGRGPPRPGSQVVPLPRAQSSVRLP